MRKPLVFLFLCCSYFVGVWVLWTLSVHLWAYQNTNLKKNIQGLSPLLLFKPVVNELSPREEEYGLILVLSDQPKAH